MQLRDCVREDIPAIAAIYAHYVLHSSATFEEVPPTAVEMAVRFDALRGQGLPYLVAELDGKVAGYASAKLYRMRSAYRFTLENSIYIDHTMVRRGIGRALLAELILRSEVLGYRQMIATIGDSGNQASINLHLAGGFTHAGVFRSVGFKFKRWLDTVMMQRCLGEGDTSQPGKSAAKQPKRSARS
jgi:L-amino acid N-acyltransferase YncA